MSTTKEKTLEGIFRDLFTDLPLEKEKWDVMGIEQWDSLSHMILLDNVEKRFSITVPPTEYLQCVSFIKILKLVENDNEKTAF